jgi:hypothetical protein
MKKIASYFLVPAPKKLKKDESESSSHLVARTSRLLQTTCSESNEDLTSKVANFEKHDSDHSCSGFHSQSLSESNDVLVSLCSEKDVVCTQTLDYSGSKLHYQQIKLKEQCSRN